MTQAEHFTTCGIALFGPEWKLPMADAVHVSVISVRRWASGKHGTVPEEIWLKVIRMLGAEAARLQGLSLEAGKLAAQSAEHRHRVQSA